MKHPYSQLYLYDVMMNLGDCLDYVKNTLNEDLRVFVHMFVNSGIANLL